MKMFGVEDREVRELEADLKTFARRALPYATRNTVNALAFQGRREWQYEIDDKLVQRNKFTRNSIRVETTRTLDVRHQKAIVGSIAPYMEDLEYGGSKTSKGREGVPVATSYSAGQEGARPRTRMPRLTNRMSRIQLRGRNRRIANRKQRNLITVREAADAGRRFVYMDLGRRRGLFRILGGRRAPRVKMVWDLSKKSYNIPAVPTMVPAMRTTQRAAALLYRADRKSVV